MPGFELRLSDLQGKKDGEKSVRTRKRKKETKGMPRLELGPSES